MTVVFCWFSNFESTPSSSYLYSKFLESFTSFTVNLRSQSVHFKTGRLCQLFCICVFLIGKKYTVAGTPHFLGNHKCSDGKTGQSKNCSRQTYRYFCQYWVKAPKIRNDYFFGSYNHHTCVAFIPQPLLIFVLIH